MTKVPFALSIITNKLIDVSEAQTGKDCNCICNSCGMEVRTKKGDTYEHHFFHYAQANVKCIYSYWVSVRDMAKQIIREASYIHIDTKIYFCRDIPFAAKNTKTAIYSFQERKGAIFILDTSIGKVELSIVTPEHPRVDTINKSVNFSSSIKIEIDLNSFSNIKIISAREELKHIILTKMSNKNFLLPVMPLKRFIKDSSEEEIELYEPEIYPYIDNTNANIIINYLSLNKDIISAYTLNVIHNMNRFYRLCTQELPEATYNEYEVVYVEKGLKFIGYKGRFFCCANINQLHVLYTYHQGSFVNIISSYTFKDVFNAMDKYINYSQSVIRTMKSDFDKEIPSHKKTYVEDRSRLKVLGLNDEVLNLNDIKTINAMKNFLPEYYKEKEKRT